MRSEPHVARPFPGLTAREYEVLKSLVRGETTKQSAQRLAVDPKTVRSHRSNLYRKLGVVNAQQAVVAAVREWLGGGA